MVSCAFCGSQYTPQPDSSGCPRCLLPSDPVPESPVEARCPAGRHRLRLELEATAFRQRPPMRKQRPLGLRVLTGSARATEPTPCPLRLEIGLSGVPVLAGPLRSCAARTRPLCRARLRRSGQEPRSTLRRPRVGRSWRVPRRRPGAVRLPFQASLTTVASRLEPMTDKSTVTVTLGSARSPHSPRRRVLGRSRTRRSAAETRYRLV